MAEGLTNPDRIRRLRKHAEGLRVAAETWKDPDTLQKLLALAEDYEQMAATLEDLQVEPTH